MTTLWGSRIIIPILYKRKQAQELENLPKVLWQVSEGAGISTRLPISSAHTLNPGALFIKNLT